VAAYDRWADYYDIAEGDRSIFVDLYGGLIKQRTRSLLELGCGTGVITMALAQRITQPDNRDVALRVTGLDESVEMLRIARSRDERIEWVLGDFRAPPLRGAYDLIICCNNSLQLLLSEEDLGAAFRAAYQLLAPGGIFAFDIYQPNLAYLSASQTDRLVFSVTDDCGRPLELRENFFYDAAPRILTVDRRLQGPGKAGVLLATIHYRLRQYFACDIDRILVQAGLVVAERYGDFDRSPFTARSKKQILVCRRSGDIAG
jgi:ubiquinone/menaquinone biosynthesis C-methylase UbiE